MLALAASQYLKATYKNLLRSQAMPYESQIGASMRLQKQLNLKNTVNYETWVKDQAPTTYADWASQIDHNIRERNAYQFIGLSSGTTGQNSKQVPYNKAMAQLFIRYQILVASLLEQEDGHSVLHDRRLVWGSTPIVDYTRNGTPRGYVSGYLSMQSPWVTRHLSYPRANTNLIVDAPKKISELAIEVRGADLKFASGVPSYLVNLFQNLNEIYNSKHLCEIFPHLNNIVYAAAPIDPYLNDLEQLVGRPLRHRGLYCSTEAPLGFEIKSIQKNRYCLNFSQIVFGFKDQKTEVIKTVDELREGDVVEVLISTPNGFRNYSTGDLICVDRRLPYLTFQILGRIGQGLNVAAEKTSIQELDAAVASIARDFNLAIPHYFAFPSRRKDRRSCYQFVFPCTQINENSLRKIETQLDQTLMGLNGDYREARLELENLAPAQASTVGPDFLRQYFAADCKQGQLKMRKTFESEKQFLELKNRISKTETPDKENFVTIN